MIVEAERELAAAGAGGRPGRFQLEAAIQSVHVQRGVTGRTNWEAVAMLYDGLVAICAHDRRPGRPGGRHRRGAGPGGGPGGTRRDLPAAAVVSYQPYWALRAHLLARRGDPAAPATPTRRRSGSPRIRR